MNKGLLLQTLQGFKKIILFVYVLLNSFTLFI